MLPWLTSVLTALKNLDRANSAPILLSGSDPKALLDLVDTLVADLLCENSQNGSACGQCAACAMRAGHSHPDLQYVFPQSLAVEKGLPVELKSGKKPSESILIDDVRRMQGFFNTASSRGAERFAVIYPFESLNMASANALLKSLEEPPNGLRFILIGHKPDMLLPTIRSRCQALQVKSPTFKERVHWLEEQGVEQAEVNLSLSMLDPFEALDLSLNQKDTLDLRKKWVLWLASPEQQQHLPAGLEKAGLSVLFELTLRVCHDLSLLAFGREPEQFPWLKPRLLWAKSLNAATVSMVYESLERESRFSHHPINPRLALEFIAQKWQTLTQ
jgi:DNA polymerase III subunit delta'